MIAMDHTNDSYFKCTVYRCFFASWKSLKEIHFETVLDMGENFQD